VPGRAAGGSLPAPVPALPAGLADSRVKGSPSAAPFARLPAGGIPQRAGSTGQGST
jgi:hypothetical protein